jgi:hypothetical protein
MQNDKTPKFSLGQVVITRPALIELFHADVQTAITRHHNGDWGDLDKEDKAQNEFALKNEGRLFSAYVGENGVKFWIITEWDRSVTTILLPSDY